MDPIFDRLGNLLRGFFQDEEPRYERHSNADEDFQNAWDELNDFLSGGTGTAKNRGPAETNKYRVIPEELRDDYNLLQVRFGAPFDEVRKSYKNLLLKYPGIPDYIFSQNLTGHLQDILHNCHAIKSPLNPPH